MPHYRRSGDIPRKRHVRHPLEHAGRSERGQIAFEELMGSAGFSGASSLLYHQNSPSAVARIDAVNEPAIAWRANHPLRPHHLRTSQLPVSAADLDAVQGRCPLLGNDQVEIAWVVAEAPSPLYRDAMGDELIYVHSGSPTLESVFGRMVLRPGDYVVIPTATTHRWVPSGRTELYVVAANGHIDIPARYLSAQGQLLEGAPFSERDQRGPDPAPLLVDGADVPVLVRTRAGITVHVHARHPFDVVGWDGCLYPWALSIHDFEPIVGRIHQPPPVHQTFAGQGFVVCSFVPRPYDFDPDAVKVPYHHANVDTDEVLFYGGGDFMSRAGSGVGVGSISLHPAGFVHGPQPGSVERSAGADRTMELAVMLDAFRPLALTDAALGVSDPSYPSTWSS